MGIGPRESNGTMACISIASNEEEAEAGNRDSSRSSYKSLLFLQVHLAANPVRPSISGAHEASNANRTVLWYEPGDCHSQLD